MGGWDRLLTICDLVRWDITLEVLALFSLDRLDTDFDKENTIHFRDFGWPHGMSLTQFAVLFDLSDEDYVDTVEYTQLFNDYPPGLTSS